jgi:phasin
MPDMPPFEIPAALREQAERNVEQARTAYARFMEMAGKAQEMVARSSEAMGTTALEIQERALRFTQANMNASFVFAAELARARDAKEALEIQARYAREQMDSYTRQAQELGKLIAEAAQKVTPKS